MLRRRVCKSRFSERKGTPLFDSRLPPERVGSVLKHIAEGCGVRQTGRLCRVNRGAVGRLSRLAGEHARDPHDELVALSPPDRQARTPQGPLQGRAEGPDRCRASARLNLYSIGCYDIVRAENGPFSPQSIP